MCVWSMKLHLFIPLYNVSLKGLPQILFLSILGNAGERIVYILEHTGNVHYLILWGKENFWWMGLQNYSLIKRTNIKEIQKKYKRNRMNFLYIWGEKIDFRLNQALRNVMYIWFCSKNIEETWNIKSELTDVRLLVNWA